MNQRTINRIAGTIATGIVSYNVYIIHTNPQLPPPITVFPLFSYENDEDNNKQNLQEYKAIALLNKNIR